MKPQTKGPSPDKRLRPDDLPSSSNNKTGVNQKKIEVILRRSKIATTPNQRKNLKGLGLSRREKPVIHSDNPSVRGMIQKVIHLVEVRRPSSSTRGTDTRRSMAEVVEIQQKRSSSPLRSKTTSKRKSATKRKPKSEAGRKTKAKSKISKKRKKS